jgi:hypothetical protein
MRNRCFFIKDGNNLGAATAHEGLFGWKSGGFTWSPLDKKEIGEEITGYQGHGDHLIYGIIRNANEKMVTVDGQRADILNLELLPQSVVKENNLKGLYLWYFESEEAGQLQEIKLLYQDTKEGIQVMDL